MVVVRGVVRGGEGGRGLRGGENKGHSGRGAHSGQGDRSARERSINDQGNERKEGEGERREVQRKGFRS